MKQKFQFERDLKDAIPDRAERKRRQAKFFARKEGKPLSDSDGESQESLLENLFRTKKKIDLYEQQIDDLHNNLAK